MEINQEIGKSKINTFDYRLYIIGEKDGDNCPNGS